MQKMTAMGHRLEAAENTWGNMQVVIWDKKTSTMTAASDHRGLGHALVIP